MVVHVLEMHILTCIKDTWLYTNFIIYVDSEYETEAKANEHEVSGDDITVQLKSYTLMYIYYIVWEEWLA